MEIPALKPGTLVRVTWLDAQDHKETWVDNADAEAFTDIDCKIVSVGFVVKAGRKYITISGDWDESDKDWGTVRKIPLAWIESIDELKAQA